MSMSAIMGWSAEHAVEGLLDRYPHNPQWFSTLRNVRCTAWEGVESASTPLLFESVIGCPAVASMAGTTASQARYMCCERPVGRNLIGVLSLLEITAGALAFSVITGDVSRGKITPLLVPGAGQDQPVILACRRAVIARVTDPHRAARARQVAIWG